MKIEGGATTATMISTGVVLRKAAAAVLGGGSVVAEYAASASRRWTSLISRMPGSWGTLFLSVARFCLVAFQATAPSISACLLRQSSGREISRCCRIPLTKNKELRTWRTPKYFYDKTLMISVHAA